MTAALPPAAPPASALPPPVPQGPAPRLPDDGQLGAAFRLHHPQAEDEGHPAVPAEPRGGDDPAAGAKGGAPEEDAPQPEEAAVALAPGEDGTADEWEFATDPEGPPPDAQPHPAAAGPANPPQAHTAGTGSATGLGLPMVDPPAAAPPFRAGADGRAADAVPAAALAHAPAALTQAKNASARLHGPPVDAAPEQARPQPSASPDARSHDRQPPQWPDPSQVARAAPGRSRAAVSAEASPDGKPAGSAAPPAPASAGTAAPELRAVAAPHPAPPPSPVAAAAPSAVLGPPLQTLPAQPPGIVPLVAGVPVAIYAAGRDAEAIRADAPAAAIEVVTARTAPPPLSAGAQLSPPAPPLPVHRQIAQAAQDLARGPVELRLSPEELGSVRLTLQAQDGGLTVQVAAERPETLHLIRRHAEVLAQALREGGFADVDLSFRQDGRRGGTAPAPAGADISAEGVIGPKSAPAAAPRLRPAAGLDLRL